MTRGKKRGGTPPRLHQVKLICFDIAFSFCYNLFVEVFKYITSAHYEIVKSVGILNPRREDGFIYGIPSDPLLWGMHTQEILKHLQKRGVSPVVLLKFIIDNSDPNAFVQEGDEDVWFKMDKRRPLRDYKREDYGLPEVVINRSIPLEEISLVNPIPRFSQDIRTLL